MVTVIFVDGAEELFETVTGLIHGQMCFLPAAFCGQGESAL